MVTSVQGNCDWVTIICYPLLLCFVILLVALCNPYSIKSKYPLKGFTRNSFIHNLFQSRKEKYTNYEEFIGKNYFYDKTAHEKSNSGAFIKLMNFY